MNAKSSIKRFQNLALLLFLLVQVGCGSGDATKDSSEKESSKGSQAEDLEKKNAQLPSWEALGVKPRGPRDDDWFEDITEKTGIRFAYQDGREKGFYQLLESVGGGVASFDYDRDGDIDLLFTGGGRFDGPPIQVRGHRPALFRNDGDLQFVDVTEQVGLTDDTLFTHGCTVGDFNRDGWPDLFIAGFGGCRLYRNEEGKRFVDVTDKSGLICKSWNVTGAWLDYDRDGWLDLYVVTYADWQPDDKRLCANDKGLRDVCGPTLFKGNRDHLFRNQGDGTFADVTDKAGLVERNRGLGVVTSDFNDDGWMDIYVVNDVQENQLYLGGERLPFSEEGIAKGVAYSASGERDGSMGVDIGDFDNDGLADIFYTNYTHQDNSLMKRLPGGGFLNISDISGVIGTSRLWVGFGTGFADFDNDGWSDLFVINGHVAYDRRDSPYFQPAQLFANIKGKKIEDISDRGGPYFDVRHAGRGASVCDLDNDGSLDLVVVHQHDPVVILRNRNPNKNWVRVSLRGTKSNTDAVGAKVTLNQNDRILTRWQRGGGGYLAYFDPRHLFPLSEAKPVEVTVRWPTGKSEVFVDLKPSQTHELVEGSGRTIMPEGRP
jgi:hypothetical protein